MTEEQYWDKDSTLVIAYRKAQEMRSERENQQAWLQGMYVYDAISRLSPILHAFAKKGTKAQPYPDAPYPISKQDSEKAETQREKANSEKGLRYMQSLMMQSERHFEERK